MQNVFIVRSKQHNATVSQTIDNFRMWSVRSKQHAYGLYGAIDTSKVTVS